MEKQIFKDIKDNDVSLSGPIRNDEPQYSEMTQEIISHRPSFAEKWALLIFLGILLLILGATWFIRYPDAVEAPAKLTAVNAPKEITVRSEGRLVNLFVHNSENISKNEVIGWLESTGNHEEVLSLSGKLDSGINMLGNGRIRDAAHLFSKHYYNLGEVQQSYQQFIVSWQQFEDYLINGFYKGKKRILEEDIQSLKYVQQSLQNQRELIEQDVSIAEETYDMNKSLLDLKALSREEFRIEKSKLVNKKMAIPQLEISLHNTEVQKRDKLREVEQLENDAAKQVVIFMQQLQSMKSIVNEWKKKYVLESPIDGKVIFTVPLQENQFLQIGKLLGYIIPEDNRFYAEAYLPQSNFGKIDTGQQVQLRFDAYPYQELGFVQGKLSYVSNVAADSGFLATIRLDNGLITSNNHQIIYKGGLTGKALIITSNIRLLDRLYYSLVKNTSLKK